MSNSNNPFKDIKNNSAIDDLKSVYDDEYIWAAIELSLSASTGILLSFEWQNFNDRQGRSITIGEQLIIALALTFLAAMFYKLILGFFKKHYQYFDITGPIDDKVIKDL